VRIRHLDGSGGDRWAPVSEVEPKRRIRLHTENYTKAWSAKPFGEYAFNTLVITVSALFGQVLSASLVGFAFARLRWPGRDFFFILVLATMMLPYEATLIPNYLIYRQLGWIDTFLPLIVPAFLGGGAFYIFLFRQFFMSLPREMDEAARVDGCSTFGIYSRILLPLCKPILATTVVLGFIQHWNDFLPPMIYLNSSENFTIAIGLRFFMGVYETDLHLMMAAATLALIPVVLVFLFGQRYFIRSIVLSGTKG
jgi:multiple sugar transport system permease protein